MILAVHSFHWGYRFVLMAIANALCRAMGDAFGPLYAAALLRAAQTLPASSTAADWSTGLRRPSYPRLGRARPRDWYAGRGRRGGRHLDESDLGAVRDQLTPNLGSFRAETGLHSTARPS